MAQKSGSAIRVLAAFEEGKRFTEELLRENERLRGSVLQERSLRQELERKTEGERLARLHEQKRLLVAELEELKNDHARLREQVTTTQEENRDFADRHVQIERQNSDLLSLYVATHQLHSTLQYNEVLRIIKEIIINMVGGEVFGIYLQDPASDELELVAQEGLAQPVGHRIGLEQDPIGSAAASGQLYLREAGPEEDPGQGTGQPLACIPLKVGRESLGIISIQRLLNHKVSFEEVDYLLFEMLGGHAASAIYVARMYSKSERKRATLENFMTLLRSDSVPQD